VRKVLPVETRSLKLGIKRLVLEAIVSADYRVEDAARALRISLPTIYRYLDRWELTPPMKPSLGVEVLRTDYVKRCRRIRKALQEVIK
jgi:hypothetical protein